MSKGVLAGLSAFFLWGILPVYWKALQHVPSLEILCQRIFWSFVLLTGLILYRKQPTWVKILKETPKAWLTYLLSSALIGMNWFIYIWSVNHGYIVEASLGYFINPLVNVVLGVLFLKEALRPWQWGAVFLAALGVGWMTWQYGSFPWISISLALSFGFYGFTRKLGPLHAINGLSLETSVLLIPVVSYLGYLSFTGQSSFLSQGWGTTVLLIFAGFMTAFPLLLFAIAVKNVNLSTVGIMQYLAPILQLLIGVFIYHEGFDQDRLIGFLFIWSALLIYTIDSYLGLKKRTRIYSQETEPALPLDS